MKDDDKVMIRIKYEVTLRVNVVETGMGVFDNAIITADQVNIFYVRRDDNMRKHVITQLENCETEDDKVIDVRILKMEELD